MNEPMPPDRQVDLISYGRSFVPRARLIRCGIVASGVRSAKPS